MTVKKDLSIDFLGVKCENPFFLSSSPVCSNYEMIKKAFEAGWAGVFYKTVGIFIADECSPRFDNVAKEGVPFVGFKNMEQISDKPMEVNLGYIKRLKEELFNLHSTMVLLKSIPFHLVNAIYHHLHSTMVLLKLSFLPCDCSF